MHVVQTIGSLAERSGGPARTVTSLSEALSREGVAVTLAAGTSASDDALILPDAALVTTCKVAGRRRFGLTGYDFTPAVRAALGGRPGEPALLHDNGIWSPANMAACGAARRLGLRYVVSPHGMLEPWAMAWHRNRKRVAWLLYQHRLLVRSAGLLATAEQERVAIRALFPRTPIAVIANGVDMPVTLVEAPPRTARTLLFMSRLHPKKNLAGLVDAWARIAADRAFDDWTLRIAGPDEGGHAAVIAARVARLGLAARVVLSGPIADADKAAAFAAADLFVLPSFSENFGIVVAEALAHGVPVVATVGTPWSELPVRGCGWWPTPDTDALTATLREALALPAAARADMGARGRAWVAAAFGWPAIAAQTAAFYEWTLHGGTRPDFVDA
ncbi:glycosyltransferase [Glacieibacterium frigidum]|uniref:Glycosyltransferase n=1 Tax=Glacieibacterium frigidum TaxID=2593303 RepID=A0A552U9J0_9SPHN|nr:glycosyltransferase [Glacieibacterium frigidum]TRW14880.1 glycosyltransferase [Glacieibacterium frigidum]